MKSLERHLLGLYDALIDDVCAYYTRDVIEWRRDRTHLHKIMEARGSKFFTIDLVAAGKHFDRCLSTRNFTSSGLAHMGPRRGGVIPRLFGGLLQKIFHQDGSLRLDADILAISLTRQLYYAAKKVKHDPDPSTTYQVYEDFFSIEGDCREPSYRWDLDSLDIPDRSRVSLQDSLPIDVSTAGEWDPWLPGMVPEFPQYTAAFPGVLGFVQRVADIISIDLGEVSQDQVQPKHGPGAVSDLRPDASKYSFPNWPEKLELEFPSSSFAFANEGLYLDLAGLEVRLSHAEPPSKLITVPKTQKGPRLIASEPVAHQWMQQGVRSWLIQRLDRSLLRQSVNLFDQTPSQRAALQASLTGRGCTIDLSSASDRLSLWTVERFFRTNSSFLRALHATRTRWVCNREDKKSDRFLVLKKFAPMGSALTFPVQSMVYAITSLACTIYTQSFGRVSYRENWIRAKLREVGPEVTVFGDDIIVPEAVYSSVSEVLAYLGLKVNTDKTFVGGNFYESCGVDAYAGVDVTPTYFLQIPTESDPASVVSAVESSNNFYLRGLWRTAAWLVSEIPAKYSTKLSIRHYTDGALGLKTASNGKHPNLKEKWNVDLQRAEEVCLVAESASSRTADPGSHSLLQWFTEKPAQDYSWSPGRSYDSRVKLRTRRVPLTPRQLSN